MKKMLLLFVICMCSVNLTMGQDTLKYSDLIGETKPNGDYSYYISKDGNVYSVGDKIQIGIPSGTNGLFVTITSVNIAGTIQVVGANAMNTNVELKKIRVGGNKRSGFKASFQTKGSTGLDNYFLFIEDGLSTGEIKSSGLTSDEALSELKKAKDKLDLGLITKEEFEKLKNELSKYIK